MDKTFLAWIVAGALAVIAAVFANWTYALFSLSYVIDRDTLTLSWGFRDVIIPIDTIQRMVPGRTLDEAHVHGLNWWGCHIGAAEVKRVGYTLFYSTHSSPDELLYVVTNQEAYALTVLNQAGFAEEVQARAALGPSNSTSTAQRRRVSRRYRSGATAWQSPPSRLARCAVRCSVATSLPEVPRPAERGAIEFPGTRRSHPRR